jgi:formylglycine-generating enzyme required for sulfatase activity
LPQSTVYYAAGLDEDAVTSIIRGLRWRRPILFAHARLVPDCHAPPAMTLEELSSPRHEVVDVDAARFPWLEAETQLVQVEYRVNAELRLDESVILQGVGKCTGITHVAEVVETGEVLEVKGDGRLATYFEPYEPLRFVLRPATIGPVRHEVRRSHAEPMVRIPGGVWQGDAVAPFWMDRYEVSVAAFRECVEAGYCIAPAYEMSTYHEVGKDEYPVSFVPWTDAAMYCAWAGKRLATLREWQWVARGREEGREHPWGSEPPDCDRAVGEESPEAFETEEEWTACVEADFHPRGSRPLGASRDGVHNLAGNVEEWVAEPWTSAGSSAADYLEDDDLGEFTALTTRRELRPTSGVRCVADEPPADALARSRPAVEWVKDLGVFVHDDQGLRRHSDAQAYCESFEARDMRGWRLPSAEILVELRRRVSLEPLPYWAADEPDSPRNKRTLCIAAPVGKETSPWAP